MNKTHPRNMLLSLMLIFFYCLLSSCIESDTYCEKTAKYIAKNKSHFFKATESDKIRLMASFQPEAAMICQDTSADPKQYQGFIYFNLSIEDKKNIGITQLIKDEYPKEEVESVINYYNFKLGEDIKLVINQDTLPCTFCHHIQRGSIGNNLLFFMAFESNPITPEDKIDLLFFDKIFSSAFHSLHFEGKQLSQLPTINN